MAISVFRTTDKKKSVSVFKSAMIGISLAAMDHIFQSYIFLPRFDTLTAQLHKYIKNETYYVDIYFYMYTVHADNTDLIDIYIPILYVVFDLLDTSQKIHTDAV